MINSSAGMVINTSTCLSPSSLSSCIAYSSEDDTNLFILAELYLKDGFSGVRVKKLFFLSCIDSVQLFFYSILYPKGFHNHRRETSSKILSHKRALGSENKVQNSTFSNSSDRSLIKLLFFLLLLFSPGSCCLDLQSRNTKVFLWLISKSLAEHLTAASGTRSLVVLIFG